MCLLLDQQKQTQIPVSLRIPPPPAPPAVSARPSLADSLSLPKINPKGLAQAGITMR